MRVCFLGVIVCLWMGKFVGIVVVSSYSTLNLIVSNISRDGVINLCRGFRKENSKTKSVSNSVYGLLYSVKLLLRGIFCEISHQSEYGRP